MATKKIDPELQALLREVEGKPPKKSKSQKGESSDVKMLFPSKPKRTTPVTRKLFSKLVKNVLDGKEKIKEIKEDLKRSENRLTIMIKDHGLKDLGNPRDRMFFVAPYKGELSWSERAGAIDEAKVLAKYPDLKKPVSEMVDLVRVREMLSIFANDEASKRTIESFVKIVDRLGTLGDVTLIEKKGEELDLEKYNEMKLTQKIPEKEVAKFESTEGSYSLRIDELSQASRCSSCGFPRPKRMQHDKALLCKRCGQKDS